MELCRLLLMIMLYQSYSAKGAIIDFPCLNETVPLLRFTQYSCSITDGSGFIQWRIIDSFSKSENTISFSTFDDSVGQNKIDDEFTATLTSETNGLTSVLLFEVTEDHSNTSIICEDTDPSDTNMSQCAVYITGPPIKPPGVDDNPISFSTTVITWIGLPCPFIVMYYEVRLNGGSSNRVYNETDTSIEINGLERDVEYTAVIEAFDNVGRRGEASELNFILDSPNMDDATVVTLCSGTISYSIVATWNRDTSSRPPTSHFNITYIVNGTQFTNTTTDTHSVINGIESNSAVQLYVIAVNALGSTVLFNESIAKNCEIPASTSSSSPSPSSSLSSSTSTTCSPSSTIEPCPTVPVPVPPSCNEDCFFVGSTIALLVIVTLVVVLVIIYVFRKYQKVKASTDEVPYFLGFMIVLYVVITAFLALLCYYFYYQSEDEFASNGDKTAYLIAFSITLLALFVVISQPVVFLCIYLLKKCKKATFSTDEAFFKGFIVTFVALVIVIVVVLIVVTVYFFIQSGKEEDTEKTCYIVGGIVSLLMLLTIIIALCTFFCKTCQTVPNEMNSSTIEMKKKSDVDI